MINLYIYHLPFNKPFSTGNGTYIERSGVIVRFQRGDIDAISEAAPLPDYSPDSLKEVQSYLAENRSSIDQFFRSNFELSSLIFWLNGLPELPSLQFAISTLGIEIFCQRNEILLSKLTGRIPNQHLQINGVIGTGSPEKLIEKAEKLKVDGITTLKCKVSKSPSELADTLRKIHETIPGLRFRLDANQSWPIDKIEEFSTLFDELTIDYIEEPAVHQTEKELDAIIAACRLPVALDESIINARALKKLAKREDIAAFIIKPSKIGNIFDLFDTIRARDHLINRCVFTTLLESGVGRKIVAKTAALFGSEKMPHGLMTGALFADDLVEGPNAVDSVIKIEDSIGFGVRFQNINQQLVEQVT